MTKLSLVENPFNSQRTPLDYIFEYTKFQLIKQMAISPRHRSWQFCHRFVFL